MYLLEDLHWADESTLALLMYLAPRIAQLPVVIVGTYRGGYSDENPALAPLTSTPARLLTICSRQNPSPTGATGPLFDIGRQERTPRRSI